MASQNNGDRFSQQLVEAGVQIGWNTRLVSFGPDVSACSVSRWGLHRRAAMAFGGVKRRATSVKTSFITKTAFSLSYWPCGFVTDEWYANAAGCH